VHEYAHEYAAPTDKNTTQGASQQPTLQRLALVSSSSSGRLAYRFTTTSTLEPDFAFSFAGGFWFRTT
jgi:hypothetical protein